MKTTKSVKEGSGRCSVLAFGPRGRKPLSLEKEEPGKDAENGLGAGKESFKIQNFHLCYFHISATMRNVHLPQIEAGSSPGKRSHLRNRMMQEMDRVRILKV